MFQLAEQPDPEKMFHSTYPFYTGSSLHMKEHFKALANLLKRNFLSPGALVLEIGSNDGTFLENLQPDYRCLGIEPSAGPAQRAIERKIPTKIDFFNLQTAQHIYEECGRASVMTAANCLCHIPDPHAVFEGIQLLLDHDGIAVLEDPYLGSVLSQTAYDQIYDEHVFLFSVTAMNFMVTKFGFEIFDLEPQWTHGGSMRYFIGRKQRRTISSNVNKFLAQEAQSGFKTISFYQGFKKRCERSKDALLDCLMDLKEKSSSVAGYAATSKSTTVLNYCGIGPDLISFISDTTPDKQGRFSPGMHIPIYSYDYFQKNYPQTAVLFAWNHAEEIMNKESAFRKAGGRWLRYVPEVRFE